MNIEAARAYIFEELRTRLDSNLFYHGLHHTRDVVSAAMELAALEGIVDKEALELLETAALYHDSGFMNVYKGHEEEGCRIVREILPDYDYSDAQAETICGMIMATKIPQMPQNKLEMILADADLDYLGRQDFETISATLYDELKARELVSDPTQWNQTQVTFLETHFYWTKSQQERRNPTKAMHLAKLKNAAH
ncbi:HD domain-containing protein [Dyadobacter crusticola]|uniref:HD domain-containing protein n=1 Tax=Dyadobacter crusticola TaxID=292407 RepID=UPI0004E23D21|nr:HD domain-containing protein [Dyadobacter crusticola]